jgi:AcrR family transcriptional regulator
VKTPATAVLRLSTRQGRRKERTRGRLVDAARRVISRKGVETTTILDITEEADVGFGTFYNYFPSKEAILAATSSEAVEAHGSALDELTADLDDAAEVIAICLRHTVRTVDHDPIWAWFVVNAGIFTEQTEAGLGRRLTRDIRAGISRRRFAKPSNLPLLLHVIGAAVWAVMRERLRGKLGPKADQELAALVLRMLGVDGDEAREIASRPLPAVSAARGESR